MKTAIIVAAAENNVIGHKGQMPWHLSTDLLRFKRLTMGHAILMGRKTWESIGRPLPGRASIVITHQRDYDPGHRQVQVAASLAEAMELAKQTDCDQDHAFIIGGGTIYELALPQADLLYFTLVHALPEGDVTFPEINWQEWRLREKTRHYADEFNDFDHDFGVYERIRR
jgi:dihydrofolate reductase